MRESEASGSGERLMGRAERRKKKGGEGDVTCGNSGSDSYPWDSTHPS